MEQASPSDSAALAELEALCFPPDEAASLESITKRLTEAPTFFRLQRDEQRGVLSGFINGTLIPGTAVTHDCMSSHCAEGTTLVIHSVSVHPDYRRRGLASRMLRSYISNLLAAAPQVTSVKLLSHGPLLQLYTKAGFAVQCLSSVHHGGEPWFECAIDLQEKRKVEQYVIDAFTTRAFGGNPAAVVLLHPHHEHKSRDEAWMQNLAGENNLAETCFLQRHKGEGFGEADSDFALRWFTPVCEVKLCGHATLASAHYLYTTQGIPRTQTISFHTLSGILTALGNATNDEIELNFPATPPSMKVEAEDRMHLLRTGLRLSPDAREVLYIGVTNQNDLFIQVTTSHFAFLLSKGVESSSIKELGGRGLILSCLGFRHLPEEEREAVISSSAASRVVSDCMANSSYDLLSRFFAPALNIEEDPVTGSAHCALGPYYKEVLVDRLEGRNRLNAFQASKRGGEVIVVVQADGRVKLIGSSVIVVKSVLQV